MCLVELVDEQEAANLLIQELAYLPLAIVQAAAYVNVNKTTFQEYLLLLVREKEGVGGRCSLKIWACHSCDLAYFVPADS